MTADFYPFEHAFLARPRPATRIINEVEGINRVCYDVTNNPREGLSESKGKF
jgi:GMP synthase (glutamine-hydrolysing)